METVVKNIIHDRVQKAMRCHVFKVTITEDASVEGVINFEAEAITRFEKSFVTFTGYVGSMGDINICVYDKDQMVDYVEI